jgi:hypothetical protein
VSKLRTKIAAGVTILAASATQQAPASGSVVKATGAEYETPDD